MDLVKSVTSDHDLIKLAEIIGIKLDSVVDISEASKSVSKGIHLILLRSSPSGVGHWVCTNSGEYLDSTGVGPPTVLGKLPYNEFQYQGTYSEFCGIYCLLWIYSKQKNRPELMKGFTDLDIDAI